MKTNTYTFQNTDHENWVSPTSGLPTSQNGKFPPVSRHSHHSVPAGIAAQYHPTRAQMLRIVRRRIAELNSPRRNAVGVYRDLKKELAALYPETNLVLFVLRDCLVEAGVTVK
ncbi:MAG: hypothetical protein H7A53_09775 [Akkermansiaceae bacterium]|nr:hypothetical protein [Akkermansiaceae bacterium]MCP5551164.1 hypothetical protein [Akkermansiaceae bacterium]